MMAVQHRELSAGGWSRLSLVEQLANVGAEVGRMLRWRDTDERLATRAFDRALELLDRSQPDAILDLLPLVL
jgi:hypothetical protein